MARHRKQLFVENLWEEVSVSGWGKGRSKRKKAQASWVHIDTKLHPYSGWWCARICAGILPEHIDQKDLHVSEHGCSKVWMLDDQELWKVIFFLNKEYFLVLLFTLVTAAKAAIACKIFMWQDDGWVFVVSFFSFSGHLFLCLPVHFSAVSLVSRPLRLSWTYVICMFSSLRSCTYVVIYCAEVVPYFLIILVVSWSISPRLSTGEQSALQPVLAVSSQEGTGQICPQLQVSPILGRW